MRPAALLMEHENARIVRDYFGRWLSADGIAELVEGSGTIEGAPLAPGVVTENFDSAPITEPYVGHDGSRQWARDMADVIDGVSMALIDVLLADDGRVVAQTSVRGKAHLTEIDVDFPLFVLLRLRDGLIHYAKGFVARDEALAAARATAA